MAQGRESSVLLAAALLSPAHTAGLIFQGKWGLGTGLCAPPPPVGPGPALPAGDEFDPDDSAVGNNVLRKAFRKLFV